MRIIKMMKTMSRIGVAALALVLLGGSIAYADNTASLAQSTDITTPDSSGAGSEDTAPPVADEDSGDDASDGDTGSDGEKSKDSTRPNVPEELVAAVTAYRDAVREWRHCIIDMVTGDATTDSCGGTPTAAGFGLSEEDILNFDLDERIANRVDRVLTRMEIKTTCLAEHASEGRKAVFDCVFAAIEAEFGEVPKRLQERRECRMADTAEAKEECGRQRRGDRVGGTDADPSGAKNGGRRGMSDA